MKKTKCYTTHFTRLDIASNLAEDKVERILKIYILNQILN